MSEVDRCERAIRRAILSGDLAPGERLPPERAYAEELGVNRTTLRAALGRLASAGLLSVRQGSGYVVQDYRRHAGLEVIAELAELSEERGEPPVRLIADVLELRRRLAEMALERIVARDEALDLEEVERAVDQLEELARSGADTEELARADIECTAAILALTGSDVLGLLLNPISTVVRGLDRLREIMFREPLTNVAGYRVLLGWLPSRDPAALPLVLDQLKQRDERNVAEIAAGRQR